MTPTVGRIVHYHSYGTPGGEFKPEPRAAIVTKVHSDTCVDLCAINPTGFFFNQSCVYSDHPAPGMWSWPPMVPAGVPRGLPVVASGPAAEQQGEPEAKPAAL